MAGFREQGYEIPFFICFWEYLDELKTYYILKEDWAFNVEIHNDVTVVLNEIC